VTGVLPIVIRKPLGQEDSRHRCELCLRSEWATQIDSSASDAGPGPRAEVLDPRLHAARILTSPETASPKAEV